MGALYGVPLLLTAAEVAAETAAQKSTEIRALMNEHGGQTTFVNSLRIITVQLEITAVGIFSLFESRLQHHYPSGSFFRQLRKSLAAANKAQAAQKIYQFHLAVNVLKHGRGESYDELLKMRDLPFVVKPPHAAFFNEGDIEEPEGLVDILSPGFFYELIWALREAHLFLEPDTWAYRPLSGEG
jgi:hypothetical protein